MKLVAVFWTSLISVLLNRISELSAISWDKLVTSESYKNVKLVTETETTFHSLYFNKEFPVSTTRIICSKFCANNATCLGFNFYPISTHYVCEFLAENFCSNRQRVALQIWPGGTVWDKLRPGMTKACIEQRFQNSNNDSLCQIGRPGCSKSYTSNELSSCTACVKTCVDCYALYKITSRYEYNCTLWPEGSSNSPIFAFCFETAVLVVKRRVNLSNGTVWPNYQMSLKDMHRISRLNVYKTFRILFTGGNNQFQSDFASFSIDSTGRLTLLFHMGGSGGNGFNVTTRGLKPSPWVEGNSTCGSFWLLNSTIASATMQCPGGDIRMFGSVNINASPKQTGLRWPRATTTNKILEYGEIRFM